MPAMPWWAMIVVVLILPLLQPVTQYGSDRLQKTLGVNQPQQVQNNVQQAADQPRPYVVYHNGQWWKFENNQWYVWSQQQQ